MTLATHQPLGGRSTLPIVASYNTTENKKNDHEGDKENTLNTKAHGTTSYGTETETTVKTTEKTTPAHVNKCNGTRDSTTTTNESTYSTSGPLSSMDRNGRTLN
jgi:hypothetical protein